MAAVSKTESPPPAAGGMAEPDPMPGSIGGLLQRAFVAITTYVERGLVQAGYDISPARAGNVMRNISPEGSTIVEIARAAGVSKQAISRQAEGLERLGYVVIETSDTDRRMRIVKPTKFGLASRYVVADLYEGIEARIEERVGTADLAAFKRVIDALQDIDAGSSRE
ncbi:MarR family winged helix-turn-helix transcriptional regulator [Amycolatopsis jiangsuensis]|uniref:DNA-binding MarR family transcriptional regulator n=1 Tax=Amycolatopsis jiangsuensis TaxID=1181879 RepID=A0A840J7Y5_9PSEU|nr:MarR family transcriptional regulator [Amycolatopsis jiangsuensis]MBB4689574.1 DNA-binding MarR family transcriptional regulator [Amycolatopsis jiangsuensis]